MSEWTLISESLPDEKEEVLLFWPVPKGKPIIRLGSMFYKPFEGDAVIWKFDLDYGDAGAWVYTNRGDDQPSHWMRINYPRSLTASAGEG